MRACSIAIGLRLAAVWLVALVAGGWIGAAYDGRSQAAYVLLVTLGVGFYRAFYHEEHHDAGPRLPSEGTQSPGVIIPGSDEEDP